MKYLLIRYDWFIKHFFFFFLSLSSLFQLDFSLLESFFVEHQNFLHTHNFTTQRAYQNQWPSCPRFSVAVLTPTTSEFDEDPSSILDPIFSMSMKVHKISSSKPRSPNLEEGLSKGWRQIKIIGNLEMDIRMGRRWKWQRNGGVGFGRRSHFDFEGLGISVDW